MHCAGDELARHLRSIGCASVAGNALGDLDHRAIPEDDADLACVLADAAGRLGAGYGAAHLADHVLLVSSAPGQRPRPRPVGSLGEAVVALAALRGFHGVPHALALHLDFDLDEPVVPLDAPPPDDGLVPTLNPSLDDLRLGVLVGPGVSRGGFIAGLAALSDSLRVPVLNSWGAKGVFRWDDPRHAGTVGLQEGDLSLAGLDDLDVLIVSGLDPAEIQPAALGGRVCVEAEPWQLAALCIDWDTNRPRAHEAESRRGFYDAVAAVVAPAYESTSVPLTPARAALHLSGARPDGGVVVVDPGLTGFWVARTFPTGEPGAVLVPATVADGFACAGALAAALEGRPVVAVVEEVSETSQRIVELARSVGRGFAVQIWGDDGVLPDSDAHARSTEADFAASAGNEVVMRSVPVALDDCDDIVAVAGAVVAWPGLDGLPR